MVDKFGGLEDARVLKIKGVRRILQDSGPDASFTRGDATKTIYESDFEKYKKLYIEPRDAPDLTPSGVFDYLLKKDMLRAGLELVCDSCRLKNWLSLNAVDDMWDCEYCGSENRTSVQLRSRGDWKFRKSGLFAKDNNQEGAIPVLLSLLAIKRISDIGNFTYSTALELSGNDIEYCETDLCVMKFARRSNVEIVIGECKSIGGSFERDDCRKLGAVAKKLSKLGSNVHVYILFAKTSDTISAGELELLAELNRSTPVIIFSNRELEPYHIYWQDGGGIDDDIPNKYPHSFAELAQNSAARYLKRRE